MFIVDEDDKIIGHYDAHLIGHDLKGPVGTDAEEYNFGPDMLAATEEVSRAALPTSPDDDQSGCAGLRARPVCEANLAQTGHDKGELRGFPSPVLR